MHDTDFVRSRKILQKTQKQIANLLGVSIKAIHSYEQGWRSIPTHVERQILFLLSRQKGQAKQKPCWVIKKCPPERKHNCPAWEFQAGNHCWMINGTICECKVRINWEEKIKICQECEVMKNLS